MTLIAAPTTNGNLISAVCGYPTIKEGPGAVGALRRRGRPGAKIYRVRRDGAWWVIDAEIS